MLKIRFSVFLSMWMLSAAVVFAQTPLSDGTVLQAKGSPYKFFMHQGKKQLIKNQYSFRELGFKKKDIVFATRKQLKQIPDGEVLEIIPSKISGIFDMHEHYREFGGMELYLDVAGKLGIGKALFVGTGMGPDNAGYKDHTRALLEMQQKYPDRIVAFCTADEADSKAPEIFEECLEQGGKGLKLLIGHPEFYDVAIDAPVVKKLFEIAREHGVPVMVHISIINLPKAKEEFKRLLNEFKDVKVQFAHYCSTVYNGVNLEQCAEFLDAYPNLSIDLSMGGGIPRYFKYMTQSEKDFQEIKDFVLKYQDRILYGTDVIVAGGNSPTQNPAWLRQRILCDLNLHLQKWYRCPVMDKKGEYPLLPGFALSEEILEKLYVENPKKFLGL